MQLQTVVLPDAVLTDSQAGTGDLTPLGTSKNLSTAWSTTLAVNNTVEPDTLALPETGFHSARDDDSYALASDWGIGADLGAIAGGEVQDIPQVIFCDFWFAGLGSDDVFNRGDGSDFQNDSRENAVALGSSGKDSLLGFANDGLSIGRAITTDLSVGDPSTGINELWQPARLDTFVSHNAFEGDRIQGVAQGLGGNLPLEQLSDSRFILGSSAASSTHRFGGNSNAGVLSFGAEGVSSRADHGPYAGAGAGFVWARLQR